MVIPSLIDPAFAKAVVVALRALFSCLFGPGLTPRQRYGRLPALEKQCYKRL